VASRLRRLTLLLVVVAVPLLAGGTASAAIGPPWCGTPEPDAAENLPPTQEGAFPHIPYYAIKCTLDEIQSRSIGGRMTVEQIGVSAQGRPMYLVKLNALETEAQRRDFQNWQLIRKDALDDPAKAKRELARVGDNFKIPIFIQAGIHGGEYEGVDADMLLIERLATTPHGSDQEVDAILDHVIVLINIDQNPDGRKLGQRANGFNFDLNRDFLTQSQSETKASVSIMQEWLPADMNDQHGYVTPTLVEATTKPHNPGIDYDFWLTWNQARIDANEAAMNAIGMAITRPINDWCSDGDPPPASGNGKCDDGRLPGPSVAEGWDDWGPFYTPMYLQLVGLNGSTVEMCNNTGTACSVPGTTPPPDFPRGRLGSRTAQYTVAWSTLQFDVANREHLMHDQLEIYRRGVAGEPRAACCPPPFDVANNWMRDYPEAYVIPLGAGQRSNPEANRLVEWLLFNGIKVSELKQSASFNGQTFEQGSYVVWMQQAHRGLAETALGIGDDVSGSISQLYAPPGAWSHGYLWGADVVTIPPGASFDAQTNEINKPSMLSGGVESGRADRYVLEIDSATAVRGLNALLDRGTAAELATTSFSGYPAGSVLFSVSGDVATKNALDRVGKDGGITFHRFGGTPPALETIERVPRIAVLANTVNQEVWSLRNLGFKADQISIATLNTAADDPLANYDIIFNTGAYPSAANATARTRITAFFAGHGGYIGALVNGANFLTAGSQLPPPPTGLTALNRSGLGRSGIVYWDNTGGINSPIVGAYPGRDTMIVDPPTWFTAVGALSVDARLPLTGFFAAGLWLLDAQSSTAPGAALIAHGNNTAGTARITVFANNPLYRADPEREWPAVSQAAYWGDQ
jgi:Zinc carboxypeptidase